MRWFPKVVRAGPKDDADLVVCIQAVDAYTEAYEEAKRCLKPSGRLEAMATKLPGLVEDIFSKAQDLDAMVEYLQTRDRKAHSTKTRFYMEGYQRTLTYAQAKDYAESSDEVQTIRVVLQQVGNARDLYVGISKGLEFMQYQIGNLTKLRVAGVEDAIFNYD